MGREFLSPVINFTREAVRGVNRRVDNYFSRDIISVRRDLVFDAIIAGGGILDAITGANIASIHPEAGVVFAVGGASMLTAAYPFIFINSVDLSVNNGWPSLDEIKETICKVR